MSKTVLIVEDVADVRAMMKILIKAYGYQPIEARDGYDAVEKAVRHHPDLIIMDLAMPIMDGIEATKMIRKIEGFDKIPIIAVSAYANSHYEVAVEAGFDEIINKPLEFESLQPLLNSYLGH
jgi:two-component system, cell cycle response regulator DivK